MSEENLDDFEKKIYEKLVEHKDMCELHASLYEALKPFIILNPKEKAKDLAYLMREEWEE